MVSAHTVKDSISSLFQRMALMDDFDCDACVVLQVEGVWVYA
jgi:hypothetical protein